jgi:hypothetical protein
MRRVTILVVVGACATPPLQLSNLDVIAIAGTQQTIAWTPGASSGAVDVVLVDSSNTEIPLATAVDDSGSLAFQVPLLPQASTFRIRIRDAHGGPEGDEGGTVRAGALVSLDWNAATMSEDYSLVDADTGSQMRLGDAGDLRWWDDKGGATFDAARGLVYVAGSIDDAQTIDKIYTLDGSTGALVASSALSGRRPAGLLVNGAGTVLGFETSEAALNVITIDPASGALTPLSSVPGPFAGWMLENAIDTANNRIYHIALSGTLATPMPTLSVYSIDATTGALVGTAAIQLNGAGISEFEGVRLDANGRLIGCRHDGSVETMIAVDPASGTATTLGTVGDLASWSGHTAYNASNGQMLVFGSNAADEPKLYAMDTTTGTLVYDLSIAKLPSAALLVY